MPNWCFNTMGVSGSKEDIDKFDNDFGTLRINEDDIKDVYNGKYKTIYEASEANSDRHDKDEAKHQFTNIVYPETYDDIANHTDIRNWFYDNIGTYSLPFDIDKFSDADDYINYTFQTRWSPCDLFVKNASAKYPNLLFDYSADESGMMIAVHGEYRNGEAISYEEFEGDNYVDYLRFIGYRDDEILEEICECNDYDYHEVVSIIDGRISRKKINKIFKENNVEPEIRKVIFARVA